MFLEQGKKYKANIELGFIEKIASNQAVSEKLTDAGFYDVVVTGTGASRTASGVWAGSSRDVHLPKQVKNVQAE